MLLVIVLSLSWGVGQVAGSTPAEAPGPLTRGPVWWQLVASEEFWWLDPDRWSVYEGVPGCCPATVWDPDRVQVGGGVLTLENHTDEQGRWLSGGVGAWSWEDANLEHGRWDARIRFDPGAGVSGTALLYPGVGWPPEINYWEIFETWGTRQQMAVTTHHGTEDDHQMQQTIVSGDFTRWHVASVRWTPTEITYVLDGRVIHVEEDLSRVPKGPMWPGFQTHVHTDVAGRDPVLPPGASSVRMQVDWLRVYQPLPTLG
ncbi:glycoside hydrolase family 16 protein [Nocardioides pacificus]